MNNTYLYLSSNGAENHSDFQVQLPNNLIFSPYSQVRLVNGIVSLNENEIEINDNNDKFYISCDFWSKVNSAIPLVPVVLTNGTYNIDELVQHLEDELNKRFRQFPNIGFTVLSDPDPVKKNEYNLIIKASFKQLYGLPSIQLPGHFITDKNGWLITEDFNAIDSAGDITEYKKMTAEISDIIPYESDIYGVTLNAGGNLSECILSGLSGGITTGEQVIFACTIDVKDDVLEEDKYILLYYGQKILLSQLTKTWGGTTFIEDVLNRFMIYIYNDGTKKVKITYRTIIAGQATFETVEYAIPVNIPGGSTPLTHLTIDMTENSDEYTSTYKIRVGTMENNDFVYIDTPNSEVDAVQTYEGMQKVFNSIDYVDGFTYNNRIGLISNTIGDIQMSICNCTEDYGFNSVTNKFEATKSIETNLNRPISILTQNTPKDSATLNPIFISAMTAQTNIEADDVLITSYLLNSNYLPNIGYDIGIDLFQVLPKDTESNSASTYSTYTNGLEFDYNVKLDNITFPQCYLEISEFPFNTYTASFEGGTTNRFLSPINFVETGTAAKGEYQANIYTEQWLTMSNSSSLNITSLRVRICDISGKILEYTKPTSIFTVEIRDNPFLRRQEERQLLNDSLKNTVQSMMMNNTSNLPRSMNGY